MRLSTGSPLIRNDAVLFYPTLQKPTGKRGHPKWYDGKVDFANLDLSNRTRFQLEFCFRDAKHYAGLNDCQSTDLRKLEFHRNASFASINIAKAACKELKTPFSISSCKSIIHNAYMLNRFICVSGLQPDPQVIDKLFKELVLFTARAA